jgi:hypothetical protein
MSRILFDFYSEYITKLALGGFGDFKIGGQVFHSVKYAYDLVLLAKEEAVLQGMIAKVTETVICYGMEMNVEKTTVMRISRQPSPMQIMMDQNRWGMWNI